MSEQIVSTFIVEWFPWLLIVILIFNLIQKKYLETAEKKRFASLYMAILVLTVFAFAALLIRVNLPDLLLIPLMVLLGAIAWIYRGKIFPFTSRCRRCEKHLGLSHILFNDSELCTDCDGNGKK